MPQTKGHLPLLTLRRLLEPVKRSVVSVGQWEKISLKYGFIPFLKRHCSPETKVKLKKAPTRREGGISLWGLCLVSAEQLLFEEGHVKVSFQSFPAGFCLWEKGENGGREHTEPHCLDGWALVWSRGGLFPGNFRSVLWVRNGGVRDVGIGKGNKQEFY